MTLRPDRYVIVVLGVLVAALVGLGLFAASLANRIGALETENASLRADIDRVESGTAIFASQITAFQEELAGLAPAVGAGLDEAVAGLDSFQSSTLEFMVPINEVVPIDVDVVIDRVVQIPVTTEIPINETFDTTITIAGPFGIDIPVDVTVPVNVTVPVDLDVEFPINETVPISTEIPVDLTVPITVDIAGTELAKLAASLQEGLISFKEVIEGLG